MERTEMAESIPASVYQHLLDCYIRRRYDIRQDPGSAVIVYGHSVVLVDPAAHGLITPTEARRCVRLALENNFDDGRSITFVGANRSRIRVSCRSVKSEDSTIGVLLDITAAGSCGSNLSADGARDHAGQLDEPRLEAAERDEISRTLAEVNGNKARACMLLGISRSSLYRKMRRYGIF
ncbi:helix-turn-helix domain-containing protein [Rhodococcus ruber]|uniref:helix-turn-helix domain-containing protein n=1 Tax=Rhodococcus ruber TaxID=1830 RepID=UPI001F340D30|nr:helix-turn-helix domain-containing protein [Rhodococcus ruber]MCF8786843.1 hypothetical protein [Rhodococcus ruber]